MFRQHTSRRSFITQGMGLIGIGATGVAIPNFVVRSALGGPKAQSDESVLVVIQLTGGHDGLSAVVPHGMDEYYNGRKASRIERNEVIKINEAVGLHPNLKPFKEMLDDGKFAIVQGVGYPNPNQSHFTSMDIWHLGDPEARTSDSSRDTSRGWIGRYADTVYAGNKDPKIAVAVGSGKAPLAIMGKDHPGISFQAPDSYRYLGDRGDKRRAESYQKLNTGMMEDPMARSLDFITQTASNANDTSREIRALASKYKSPVSYPRTGLANSLATVAGLIAGGLNTRIYYVFHTGYDTHAGQRQRHDRLMLELGEAALAFQKDLIAQKNDRRVLTMSFSEFGRRLDENYSEGTDHGMAGPMFVFGSAVKPGLHGAHPSLKEADLVMKRDLKFTTDFRSVYATVLEKWLKTPSQPVIGTQMPLLNLLA